HRRRVEAAANNGEGGIVGGAGAGHQGVGEGVPAVHVGGRERAHGGAAGAVLVHVVVGQGDVGGGLVDVVHQDGERLLEEEPAGIGGSHPNVVAALHLVVEHRR